MAQQAQQYPQQEPWLPGPEPTPQQQAYNEAPHYPQPQYQGQGPVQGQGQGQPYLNPAAQPQYPQPYAPQQGQQYPPAPQQQQYQQPAYPQPQPLHQSYLQPQYPAPPQQYAGPPQQQYPQAYAPHQPQPQPQQMPQPQPQYPMQNPYPPAPPQQYAPQGQYPAAPPQLPQPPQPPQPQYAPQNLYATAPPQQQYPPQNQYPPAAPPQQYAPGQPAMNAGYPPPPAPKVRDAFAKGAAPYLQQGEQVYYGFILKLDDTIEETPREFQIEIEGQHHALGDVHRASAKINKGMKWAANPLDALNERLAEKATEALNRHLAGPVFVGGWQSQAGLLIRYIRATAEDYGPGAYGAVTNQRYLVFRGARLGGSAMRLVYAVPRAAIAGVRLEGTKDAVLHGRTPRAELHFTDQSMVATMMPTKQGEQLQAAFLQPVHPPMPQQPQQQMHPMQPMQQQPPMQYS